MRITDVVTPQELFEVFTRELQDVRRFGSRNDLKQKYIEELSQRISDEYLKAIALATGLNFAEASSMLRLLALLDRFLEEKYGSKTTN